MNNLPFFSVVVPVFNRSNLLVHTLSFILNQTFNNFEIIVVNDGSTDNTLEELQRNFGNEKRIKIITQVNAERGVARNNGLKKSSGKYVVFFDSDDIMHASHLDVLHAKINEQQFPAFIATKFDFIDEKGNHHSSDIQSLKEGYYDYRLFLNGNPLACNVCVLKDNPLLSLFEEDRNFAIKEDWMFLIQNMKSNKLFIIDRVTISMNDHEHRSMRSDNKMIIKRTLAAGEWISKRIELTKEEEKQLQAHISYFCGIHAYLDEEKKNSISFSLKAMRAGGLKVKYISLFVKSIVGRKVISLFK